MLSARSSVAWFETVAVHSVLAELPHVRLSAIEEARAERFHDRNDAKAFVASRNLLKLLVGSWLHLAPSSVVIEQRCSSCSATEHGRPVVANDPSLRISISRSKFWIAAGVSPTNIGVDVEGHDSDSTLHRVSKRALSPREQRHVDDSADPTRVLRDYWVRKEALIKVGVGSLGQMHRLDIGPHGSDPDRVAERFETWQFTERSRHGMSSVAVVDVFAGVEVTSPFKGDEFAFCNS